MPARIMSPLLLGFLLGSVACGQNYDATALNSQGWQTPLPGAGASPMPVLPVALAARVFLAEGKQWTGELELKSRVFDLIEQFERHHAHVLIPRADRDYAVATGLRMLTLRHLVEQNEDGLYRANPKERVLLEYYANSIAHLM